MIQPRGFIARQSNLVIVSSTLRDGNLGRFSNRYTAAQASVRKKFFSRFQLSVKDIIFLRPNRMNTIATDSVSAPSVVADAMIMTKPDVYAGVTTADCIPLVVYDPVKQLAALCHVGWHDIAKRLPGHLIRTLVGKHQCNPKNFLVYFGPAISHECYRQAGWRGLLKAALLISRGHRKTLYWQKGYIHFDLKKALLRDLVRLGVDHGRIEVAPYCTVCSADLFPSNVRERAARTQSIFTIVGLRKSA